MAVGDSAVVRSLFSMKDIQDAFNLAEDTIEQEEAEIFIRVGKEFVSNGRQKGAFQNHTFNLRSSYGCEVLRNGKSIFRDYLQVGDGAQGVRDAKKLIRELRANFPNGLALVVVCAEGYASAVENRNKDVLTGSSLIAQAELRRLLA